MRTALVLCAGLCVLCARSYAADEGTPDARVLEIEGVVGRSGLSFEDAKLDAMRKAVERVAGSEVYRSTYARDFQLLHDVILSRAAGYVRRHGLLRQWKEDDEFRVQGNFVVARGAVGKDLGEISVLLGMRRPRVLLIVGKSEGDLPVPGNPAERVLSKMLLDLNVRVVDQGMLDVIDERDAIRAQILEDDRKAAATAARVRASHVLAAKVTANAERINSYGLNVVNTIAEVTVRAVAANADLIASESGKGVEQLRISPPAVKSAVEKAARDAGTRAIAAMLKYWSREIYDGHHVDLYGSRIPTEIVQQLRERLGRVDRVLSVTVRNHDEELETLIEVKARLTIPSLAREIERVSGGRVRITAMQDGRIDIVLRNVRRDGDAP